MLWRSYHFYCISPLKSPPIQDSEDESDDDASESESMDTAAVRRHALQDEDEGRDKKKAKTV